MIKPDSVSKAKSPVIENTWQRLQAFTDARIGLGRAGISLPTQHLLAFQLDHARAQDAVHHPFDVDRLALELKRRLKQPFEQQSGEQQPWSASNEVFCLHSEAPDRASYLQRPDYGRSLNTASKQKLTGHLVEAEVVESEEPVELVIVIADGLSALAIEENVVPFLETLIPKLLQSPSPWRIAPLCIVEQGRVAIGDMVGELLSAQCVMVLIGERPGLSSPDSMGLYLTWNPKVGRSDAQRNCISNIRPAGLQYSDACHKAVYLLTEARRRQLSGVQLKERSEEVNIEDKSHNPNNNFLVPSPGREDTSV
ncbi:ethanolamine ammonia-lyase subunit EutC [Pseudomaricurvus sp.]|uniref:ethanolamine ammonia-lyase subunit EutC n=1 Tax=Pseudomaricurvus sp. TaxID=2004510 RepID=UPI003F6D5519